MYIDTLNSLEPYKQELSKSKLLHLLTRCLFGASHQDVRYFEAKTLDQCLDILLSKSPTPEMIAQDDPDTKDPLVPAGSQWVDAPYENEELDKRRRIYLKAWWVGQIINRDHSLTEKMTLFWHNHFVTETEIVKDARYSYQYLCMLRSHALGNFKKLIREGTTNTAMLVYLNGNSNNKAAPNENYSRELLELFTLGKEAHVKYTEDDIKAAARVLTGWKDDKERIQSSFHAELHDTNDKHFSAFFDNTVIKGRTGENGASETDDLIDMIFKREEAARYLCRNLYRWFVCSNIDDNIEGAIIAPLAKILISNDFEVRPVLRALLGSQHFFDTAFIGSIVKSPADFWLGANHQFGITLPSIPQDEHLCWVHTSFSLGGLSMLIGDPPSVAGWPAFYQAPKYHQWWINSYTLGFRSKIMNSLSTHDGLQCNGPIIKFSFTDFVSQFEKPEDPDQLIQSCLDFLLPVAISPSEKMKLKEILLSGQSANHYWTDAWNKFISSGVNNTEDKEVVETRLCRFFIKVLNMPEYQIM